MSSHVAYSDESNWNHGQYRSIALITLPIDEGQRLAREVSHVLADSGVSSEFKWTKVRNRRYRKVADRMIDLIFENLTCTRVDVLTWDTQDDRHDVPGRDDLANLERMYYHLVLNVGSSPVSLAPSLDK